MENTIYILMSLKLTTRYVLKQKATLCLKKRSFTDITCLSTWQPPAAAIQDFLNAV